MFDDRRVNTLFVGASGSQESDGGIEIEMRNALETIGAAFRTIELKYGYSLKDVLEYLEAHGYDARSTLFSWQEKIDSDIYGRMLTHTASDDEIRAWRADLTKWVRAACGLTEEFENTKKKSAEHSVTLS
jgi:hypothetical protein